MLAYEIIKKKRDNTQLTREELEFIINGFVNGIIPDYQMSAFLMAVFFRGMSEEETFWLTEIMRKSGEQVDLSGIEGYTIDKHSTGGVGDKTSLVLGPVLAALGFKVAKLSGRGLGHTGGTIDKLESIPGFRCELSKDEFIKIVNEVGLAIIGQTPNLVPADKKIYSLRDVTATVDSIPLIAASIMSKKLSVNNKGLILDVKVGSGAFMKTLQEARELAKIMVKIGKMAKRSIAAVISNMDEPLGNLVGNALEVKESIYTLQGKGPSDLYNLVKTLAETALLIKDRSIPKQDASSMVEDVIRSGKAFEKFVLMVKMQGGDISVIENPDRLPKSNTVVDVLSDREGYVSFINCEDVGIAAMMLGAGREKKDSIIDPAVGIEVIKKVGSYVNKGDVLARFYINDNKKYQQAYEKLLNAYTISDNFTSAKPLILDIIE